MSSAAACKRAASVARNDDDDSTRDIIAVPVLSRSREAGGRRVATGRAMPLEMLSRRKCVQAGGIRARCMRSPRDVEIVLAALSTIDFSAAHASWRLWTALLAMSLLLGTTGFLVGAMFGFVVGHSTGCGII